jgi:ribosomal-protein-alanine N-acetyltransferase
MKVTTLPRIWLAGPADAPLLAALHASSFERGWRADEMAQFLGSPGCIVLLAAPSEDDTPTGMIIVRGAGEEAELLTIAVRPDCRRRGLARALLAAAAETLRNGGVRKLFLEVEEGNVAARGLYSSLGSVEIGTRKRYYESGADASIFSLAL